MTWKCCDCVVHGRKVWIWLHRHTSHNKCLCYKNNSDFAVHSGTDLEHAGYTLISYDSHICNCQNHLDTHPYPHRSLHPFAYHIRLPNHLHQSPSDPPCLVFSHNYRKHRQPHLRLGPADQYSTQWGSYHMYSLQDKREVHCDTWLTMSPVPAVYSSELHALYIPLFQKCRLYWNVRKLISSIRRVYCQRFMSSLRLLLVYVVKACTCETKAQL